MRRPKSRLKACDYCRAHRLGCDRVKREPEPCSGCQDRRLVCTFTVPTNRVPSEHRSKDVRRLSAGKSPCARDDCHNGDASIVSRQQPSKVKVAEYCGGSQDANGIVVSTSDINNAFQYFFQSMHPHFPFLDPATFSIARTLEASPLLFWTILAIASNFRNRPLYTTLQGFVRGLVAQVLYPSGHGLETCQALCLLCLWPLEGQDPNDEPVYLYAGLLTHLAMRTGLHRARWQHEYKNINESRALHEPHSVHDKLNTWATCIFAEHHHACKNGIPSGIRQDWPIRSELLGPRPSGTSPVFHPTIKSLVALCLIQDRHLNIICFEGQTPSGLIPPKERAGHIKLFSAALDDFELANPSLSTQSAIFLQFTRVMAGGLCLARDLQAEPFLRGECCNIVSTAVSAAEAILDLMAPLAWETVPTHTLRSVHYAGVFAAQVLRLQWGPPPGFVVVDIVTILQRALDIMRHLAYGHDLATRSKVILETELQRYTGAQSDAQGDSADVMHVSGLGIEFQTRMGAAMYWDLIERDKPKHNWDQNADNIYRELLSSEVLPNIM